jgi:hypothetical protein
MKPFDGVTEFCNSIITKNLYLHQKNPFALSIIKL